ncbi:nucleotide exchange factor GrpE [uncultured Sanguibacteroides sp.]
MSEEKKRKQEEELTEAQHVSESKSEGHEESSKKKDKSCKKEESQLEEMGQKLMEMNDKYLRLSAEFDNYRKRTLKERVELTKTAGEQVLTGILPVVDNFERALASMEKAKDVVALKEGVDLIYANFKDFLMRNGVKVIETENVDFNTDLHEAVTTIPAPTEEQKGKVIDCIEKGYTLNDKVIRFAKVVVGE